MSDSTQTQAVQEGDSSLISFGLIADAGDAKSLAFMALGKAKEGDFDAAGDLMGQSNDAYLRAHEKQTSLLVKEANGDHTPVDVMLVHAQDHLMGSCLARQLIEEIIYLHKKVAELSACLDREKEA